MRFLLLLCFSVNALQIFAQADTAKKINISAYGELYYSYDFSRPANHDKPDFLYNHKRHNELNANLLLLKASYADKNLRANLAAMAGNYAQYNLSAEPDWAKFIYEANLGVKISGKANIWLDAGIMPSHIGFGSAVSADCWTLTRSLVAESSPYYEAGIKLSYTSKNEKLHAAAMLLNGWQRIRRPDGMQRPSFGTQLVYKPSETISLNYNTFFGSDKPDSLHSLRHFHNFYLQYQPTKNFGLIAGFDLGMENINRGKFSNWFAPVLIVRQRISDKMRVALRGEYYQDRDQVIINTGTMNGFQTLGISSNFDYDINKKVTCRLEGKMYHAKDPIFNSNSSNRNYSITSNISIKLGK